MPHLRSRLSLLSRMTPVALVAVLALITLGAAPAQLASAEEMNGQQPLLPVTTPGSDQAAPAPDGADELLSASDCPVPAEGETVACIEQGHAEAAQPVEREDTISPQAIVPLPDFCLEHAFDGIWANRTQACSISRLTYTTYVTVDGVRTETGVAYLNVVNYTYSSTSDPLWVHQFEVSATQASWGDALRAVISASPSAVGQCSLQVEDVTFDNGPLMPVSNWRKGEAPFVTTAADAGEIGYCDTTWRLTFTNAGYTPAVTSYTRDDIRCDNDTAGNNTVGCVVPWYASMMVFSESAYPSLTSHISRAQASGLPGATFDDPLTRTTSELIKDENRRLACGSAPSISGQSCDEYPMARTYEGLSAGGELRSFPGCSINAPQRTGPTGASACMITATENNAQGGIMTQFFRSERVLDRDPFRVIIGP